LPTIVAGMAPFTETLRPKPDIREVDEADAVRHH